MNPRVVSLFLSLPVRSLLWVLWSEAGIWSKSQHHMLHNSPTGAVIAEAFMKYSATKVHGVAANDVEGRKGEQHRVAPRKRSAGCPTDIG